MAIYMTIDGIKGSVTSTNHQGAIELLSIDNGGSRSVHTRTGIGNNRENGVVHFQEMSISKRVDLSSSDIQQRFLSAQSIPSVTIDILNSKSDDTPSLSYTLSDVVISSAHESHSFDAGLPIEHLTLNFVKIEKRYTLKDSTGSSQSPKTVGYKTDTAEMM